MNHPTPTPTRRIPAWPGNVPDLSHLVLSEMLAETHEHEQAKRDHIWVCEGCDDCRDWQAGDVQ